MPVGRIILKTISESSKIARLKTDGARLLYTWLIPHLDVHGCFYADPQVLNGKVFTRLKKTPKIVVEYLADLQKVGLIKIYRSGEDDYLVVPDFSDKQPSLNPDREGKSNIPRPTPEQLRSNSGSTPLNIIEVNRREDKGREGGSPFNFYVNTWNEKAKTLGLISVLKCSKDREKRISARHSAEFKAEFPKILEKISKSEFLLGKNDRGWKVDFDFLFANDTNYLKILEGKYGERAEKIHPKASYHVPLAAKKESGVPMPKEVRELMNGIGKSM